MRKSRQQSPVTSIANGIWTVRRWSGVRSSPPRVIYSGESEEIAKEKFAHVASGIQAGFVTLQQPDGVVDVEPREVFQAVFGAQPRRRIAKA